MIDFFFSHLIFLLFQILVCKLLRPPHGLSDVTATSCSLGHQRGAPRSPTQVMTHSHRPIRGQEGRRALWEGEDSQSDTRWQGTSLPLVTSQSHRRPLPWEPDRHTEPSQNAAGERAASRDCEERRRSADSPSSSRSDGEEVRGQNRPGALWGAGRGGGWGGVSSPTGSRRPRWTPAHPSHCSSPAGPGPEL